MRRIAAVCAAAQVWAAAAFGAAVRVQIEPPRLAVLPGLLAAASVRPALALPRSSLLAPALSAPRPEKLPVPAVVKSAAQATARVETSLKDAGSKPAEDSASAAAALFEAGSLAPDLTLLGKPPVSNVPVWEYDPKEGVRPPSGYAGAPPGCLILKAPAGVGFPGALSFKGEAYSHLRNGFYIGAHATDRDIAGLFDVLAPDYEQTEISVPFNLKVYGGLAAAAAQAGSGKPVSKVLDFASGTGVGAPALARAFPGAALHGFDLSPKMRALSEKRGLAPVGETAGRMDLPDASVDAVVGSFILHLIRSPEWINEIARVMKPGAAAAFNVYKPAKGWKELYRTWFEAAGLEVVESPRTGLPMPVMVVRKR